MRSSTPILNVRHLEAWYGESHILHGIDFEIRSGEFVNLRMPYPQGFFTKNVDGRIDDANAGWKGRGIWTTSGTRANFHSEGGKEAYPKVFKVQMRPDPLAH